MTTRFGNDDETYFSVGSAHQTKAYGIQATTFGDAENAELDKITAMCAAGSGTRDAKAVIYTFTGTLLGVSEIVAGFDTTYVWRDFIFLTKPTLSANTTYLLGLLGNLSFVGIRINNDAHLAWQDLNSDYDNPPASITPDFANNHPLVYGTYTSGVGPSVVFPEIISKHIGVR